ncbi:MAG: hypothetical protein DLM58_13365 [Pseudonocardiales bacterium]|nr:MAG: hypothetical protein DLM58_13365 [Pseudonocardiales bacterium]
MTYPPPPDQPQYGPPPQGQPQYRPQAPPGYHGQPQPSQYGQPVTGYGYPVSTKQRRRTEPLIGWLLLGAGVLLVIAGLMPWATVLDISVAGTVGGGAVTLFFGLVIAAFGVVIGLRQGLLGFSITACVLAALAVLIALANMANIKSLTNDQQAVLLGNTVSIGIGLWLTLVASLAALTLSILGIVRRPAQTARH